MSDEMSAYELERLENIKRNSEVLASLGLGGDASQLSGKSRSQPVPKRRKTEPKPPSEPARRSSRLEGAKAPDFYIAHESASGAVQVGGDKSALDAAHEEEKQVKQMSPLTQFGLGGMPEGESELLESEQAAFAALRDVKRAKASELQIEGAPANVCP